MVTLKRAHSDSQTHVRTSQGPEWPRTSMTAVSMQSHVDHEQQTTAMLTTSPVSICPAPTGSQNLSLGLTHTPGHRQHSFLRARGCTNTTTRSHAATTAALPHDHVPSHAQATGSHTHILLHTHRIQLHTSQMASATQGSATRSQTASRRHMGP